MALALAVLAPVGAAVATAWPAGAVERRGRLTPALAVVGVHSPCGTVVALDRSFLLVAFQADGLAPGNRYVLVAAGPQGQGTAPMLYEFDARRSAFATRGVRLYPIVAGVPLPRHAFVARFQLDDLGPVGGSPDVYGRSPSNTVAAVVPACR